MAATGKRGRPRRWARLRRRAWLSAPLLLCGLLAIAFALVPQPWRDAVAAALGVAFAWLSALGVLVVALGVGVGLLLAAMLLLLVPRRTHPQTSATVNGIAPVSVYLDIENGQVAAAEVRELMKHIRAIALDRPTDLLFYGNAEPKTENYRQFWRHGFRPIDVPYRQLGKRTATNIADLGLALHAFERALFGPPNQTIVIISHDQGFLPLVYRLHALGHTVAVWARDVQDSYKDAAKYLAGVTWQNLAFPPQQERAAIVSSAPAVRTRPKSPSRGPSAGVQPFATRTIATVTLAMESTRACVRDLEGKPNAAKRLRATLGEVREHVLDQIGYTKFSSASSRVQCWLEHLGALKVLDGVVVGKMPALGPTSPQTASVLFEQFVREVADAVTQMEGAGRQTVKLADVCTRVTEHPPLAADPMLAPLRALLAQDDRRGEQHARYFCQCARVLGMVSFADTQDPYSIRLAPRAAGAAALDPSIAAPADDVTAPDGADRAGTSPRA